MIRPKHWPDRRLVAEPTDHRHRLAITRNAVVQCRGANHCPCRATLCEPLARALAALGEWRGFRDGLPRQTRGLSGLTGWRRRNSTFTAFPPTSKRSWPTTLSVRQRRCR
ncbi:hypothetical protein DSL92_00645 [Billgrantia gudaonensis]|uniref:Uncharacterized protein n=1 Tax=Billgrantia gudaonensis TaxID=376427 RepID=A0A432JM11_9GAMM|nr:hypothetical protein DSL92_00645 [Halomonas gudaonensis]